MSTLSQMRSSLAVALSTIDGLNVRSKPFANAPRAGDGWVVAQRLAPSAFSMKKATLSVFIFLGGDAALAEDKFDTLAPAVMETLDSGFNAADVSIAALDVVVDTAGASIPALQLTLTVEVD